MRRLRLLFSGTQRSQLNHVATHPIPMSAPLFALIQTDESDYCDDSLIRNI
jgi:hypothetical protein